GDLAADGLIDILVSAEAPGQCYGQPGEQTHHSHQASDGALPSDRTRCCTHLCSSAVSHPDIVSRSARPQASTCHAASAVSAPRQPAFGREPLEVDTSMCTIRRQCPS